MVSPQRNYSEPSLSQRRALAVSITSPRQLVEFKGAVQSVPKSPPPAPPRGRKESEAMHQKQKKLCISDTLCCGNTRYRDTEYFRALRASFRNQVSGSTPRFKNPFKSFKSLIQASFYSPRPISPLSGELEGSWGWG